MLLYLIKTNKINNYIWKWYHGNMLRYLICKYVPTLHLLFDLTYSFYIPILTLPNLFLKVNEIIKSTKAFFKKNY